MNSFGEILQYFKDTAEPDLIVPMVEDKDLRNGVCAWKAVTIHHLKQEDCPCKEEIARWNWLWTRIQYDEETFAVVAGVKTTDSRRLITRLIGLRLIYPDGTVNRLASQYLQAIVLGKLPKSPPPTKPKKKKDDEKGEN